MNRREFSKLIAGSASLLLPRVGVAAAPARIEPATHRTPALREFEKLQFGVSYHFSMNTFTGNDYETGSVPASTYNPTNLDVRQWIRVARDLGAKYAVLTAKHMSGFCLWDSANYDYDVAASPNKTDVVAAFVAACKEYGLKHGFYYCILDPHNEGKFDWDIPVQEGYYKLIKQQLTELHSKYPNTFYQLLDITWKLSQDQRWEIYELIKKYSPHGIVVMNQAYYQSKRNLGRICEPKSWPTDVINGEDQLPPPEGHDPHVKFEGKTYYMPMEAWIPTGPPYKPMPPMNSWFWRPGFKIQSADKIASYYSDCRKRNSNLLLNLSPDTTGRLPEDGVETLHQAARIINRKS
ncbi:MAG TPA: alpha-L-fucosidase [Terriglobales bacterium]|jgi:alpha-L-fucosidase|nr:alpha-L-fucosidase [Terriglobales bacterium]